MVARSATRLPAGYEGLDLLATMVAVVGPRGDCLFANGSFETVLGLSRKALLKARMTDWLTEPHRLTETLEAVSRNEYATARFDAALRRPPGSHPETLPVQVIVNQTDSADRMVVELVEIEQQTRLDREERTFDQVQATKELIRNLAHEIKNPLGGIRGAAQLLAMELNQPLGRNKADAPSRGDAGGGQGVWVPRELTEYTQVIVQEADRLQSLVDRLLAPHRRPHVVGDVNIHEVCERVRALIMAEFPRGLAVERDYDISIPEFRGDREQLIQAVLNITHNAAQARAARLAEGDAVLWLHTRIARQVTIGKRRWRLALELHIEDNGPGIPDSIRDRIFYPLVSGRDGGSGLGLTLAQTFVQQHQGTIECDSQPGHTVFKIVIPLP